MTVEFGGSRPRTTSTGLCWFGGKSYGDSYSLIKALLLLTLTSFGIMPQSLQSSLGREEAPSICGAYGAGS